MNYLNIDFGIYLNIEDGWINMKTEEYKYTLIQEGGRVDVYQSTTLIGMTFKVIKDKLYRRFSKWKNQNTNFG